nr:MAG TPA: hypothetical protein [Caudoviricetes sp.]
MLPAAQLHYNRFILTTSLPLFAFLEHIAKFFHVCASCCTITL